MAGEQIGLCIGAEAVVVLKLTGSFILSVHSILSLLSNAAVPGSKKPRQVPAFSKGMLNRKYKTSLLD